MADAIIWDGLRIPTAFMTERLATQLEVVWNALPERDRHCIIKYWSAKEQQGILPVPVFAVTNTRVDRKALAATNMHGFMLRFWKDFVDSGIESKVRDVIAHELAHVFDLATNGNSASLSEVLADETMKRWGFDPNSVKDEEESKPC